MFHNNLICIKIDNRQVPSKAINAKLNAVSGVVNSKIKVLENLSGLVSGGLHNSHG